MKLITFVHNSQYRLGALLTLEGHERVYDLNRLEPHLPADMLAFLEAGQTALALARQTLTTVTLAQGLDPADVAIKAPILRPGKIICIGQNYLAHAKESGADSHLSPLSSPSTPTPLSATTSPSLSRAPSKNRITKASWLSSSAAGEPDYSPRDPLGPPP